MVKIYWLAVALAIGLALGLLFGGASEAPEPPHADAPAPASPEVSLGFEAVGGEVVNGNRALRVETTETLHAEFLREDRDDSWAYIREAELESEMLEEISTGRFSKERIECRATLCEMHLTATGAEQTAALKKWFEERNELLREPRPNSQLQMRMSSYTNQSEQGLAEVKFTYQKPMQFMAAPARN